MAAEQSLGAIEGAGAVKLVASQRALLAFLAIVTLAALWILLGPARGGGWMFGALTGIVAAAAALMACARVALGTLNPAARRIWQAAIVFLVLAGIAQFVVELPANDGRLLALTIAFILLALGSWFDPMPSVAGYVLWLAAALQAVATIVGFLVDTSGAAAGFLSLAALQLCLLGFTLLVAAARRDLFLHRSRVTEVGDLARYLFATSGLFKKVRHPRIGNYTVPGHKFVFVLGRFLHWFPQMAPQVRARFGIGLWRQFVDLCTVAFQHGLDAQVYYMFEFYRSERRARSAGYLTRYEMKNGLYKVLTWQVVKSRRRIMLGDKLGMYRICEANNIAAVPILLVAEDGKLEYLRDHPAGLKQDLFLKPRQAKGSKGAEFIRYDGGAYTRETGATMDDAALMAYIVQRSREEAMLVQPRIFNHPGLADLAETALMRIRTITCLDERGTPILTHAVLSNLCKLEINWPTDIEYGAAIDLQSGALGPMTGDKAEAWLDWSDTHPVTGARVTGRIVPHWDQVRAMSLAAHAACNDRLLIGWDIAVGPDGAMMLEGNSYPDVDFLQRSHRCGIGDSTLGPLLYARLVDLEYRRTSGTLRGPLDYETEESAK